MNALLATAILALLNPAPQKGSVQVKVNAKPGETITGERTFRVTVVAKNPVTGVEFYVGSDLRDKDSSTPYEFTVDSLSETDGDLKLRFKAFTTEGESGEASVTIKVDNGTSKGLDFHLTKGREALQDSKFADAVTAGRIALRIDPKSAEAKVIVARGYLGLGTLDKAQKYAEDAVDSSPNDAAAASMLSTIKLKQAFLTMNSGTDRQETLNTITEAMKTAVETRRKFVDKSFDAMSSPTDETLIPYTDAALADGRYSAAVTALQPAFQKDDRRADVGNRLAFALTRLGRYNDALTVLSKVRRGAPDGYTFAQLAVLYAELGDPDGSDAAMKEALLSDPEDPAVLSAQAYLALKYVRQKLVNKTSLLLFYDDFGGSDGTARATARTALRNALSQMEKGQGGTAILSYYQSALSNKLEDFPKGQSYFERSVLADPLTVDAYIEQGNRSVGSTFNGTPSKEEIQQRLGAARAYYGAALAAQPSSAAALAGLSLVATIEGKLDEAIKWGESAVRAQPTYAAGYVVLGTAYNLGSIAARLQADKLRTANNTAGTSGAERQENETKARQLESQATTYARNARDTAASGAKQDARLEGYELSKPYAAYRYLYAGGRIPVLPLPK